VDDPAAAAERAAAAAAAAEPLLRLPRRPRWAPTMSPADLDASERAAFLEWRRGLADLENDPALTLTPFEKNIEVWRQLWRVVERSHVVVQVVDCREPLRYYSPDVAALAADVAAPGPGPRSLVLLNKADLLPPSARAAWAAHFGAMGVDTVFWSAKAADEWAKAAASAAAAGDVPPPLPAGGADPDPATRVVGVEELLDRLQAAAEAGRDAMAAGDGGRVGPSDRPTAGLVGFPNVGKSSTLNALFGRKKAAVAPTPGRTKHFQTLDVADRSLTLADCPGLVLPRAAASKADMVAAGVVPIPRLTDVRAPADVVARRVGRAGLEAAYGVNLPPPPPDAPADTPPTGAALLRTLAAARGWVVQNALPDEARAGRLLLRDYCSGKLPHWEWPPGVDAPKAEAEAGAGAAAPPTPTAPPSLAPLSLHPGGELALDDLEAGVAAAAKAAAKARRPDYKFQRRAARTKGTRGIARDGDGVATDGGALCTGKRGGLRPVGA